MYLGPKILLGGTLALSIADLPVDGWEKAGLVTLLLVAVGALYRDASKRQDKLEKIIANNSAVVSAVTSKIDSFERLQVEVKDAVRLCPGWQEAQRSKPR
jgi:hypothetical protein